MDWKDKIVWTKELLAFVKEHYVDKGMSASKVAKALGKKLNRTVTKSSVIGVLHRNKISELRVTQPRHHRKTTPKPAYLGKKHFRVKPWTERGDDGKGKKWNYGSGSFQEPSARSTPGSASLPIKEGDTPRGEQVDFTDLKVTSCRWPYDHEDCNTTYCGKKIDPESSYAFCSYHRERATRKTNQLIIPKELHEENTHVKKAD